MGCIYNLARPGKHVNRQVKRAKWYVECETVVGAQVGIIRRVQERRHASGEWGGVWRGKNPLKLKGRKGNEKSPRARNVCNHGSGTGERLNPKLGNAGSQDATARKPDRGGRKDWERGKGMERGGWGSNEQGRTPNACVRCDLHNALLHLPSGSPRGHYNLHLQVSVCLSSVSLGWFGASLGGQKYLKVGKRTTTILRVWGRKKVEFSQREVTVLGSSLVRNTSKELWGLAESLGSS